MYPPDYFIPAHRDVTGEGHLAMVIVPLQSHPKQGVTWCEGPALNKPHHVIDEIGQALIFRSLATIHAVLPVSELRLSIVFCTGNTMALTSPVCRGYCVGELPPVTRLVQRANKTCLDELMSALSAGLAPSFLPGCFAVGFDRRMLLIERVVASGEGD